MFWYGFIVYHMIHTFDNVDEHGEYGWGLRMDVCCIYGSRDLFAILDFCDGHASLCLQVSIGICHYFSEMSDSCHMRIIDIESSLIWNIGE